MRGPVVVLCSRRGALTSSRNALCARQRSQEDAQAAQDWRSDDLICDRVEQERGHETQQGCPHRHTPALSTGAFQ